MPTRTIEIKSSDHPARRGAPIAVYDESEGQDPNDRLIAVFPNFRAALSVVCRTPNRWPSHLVWDYALDPV
jgi:hypothetical protein